MLRICEEEEEEEEAAAAAAAEAEAEAEAEILLWLYGPEKFPGLSRNRPANTPAVFYHSWFPCSYMYAPILPEES